MTKRVPSRELRWRDDLLGEGVEAGCPLAVGRPTSWSQTGPVFDIGHDMDSRGRTTSEELWGEFLDRAGLINPDHRSTVLAISRIPYGRSATSTASAVIRDWRGTCSTKHLLLRELFEGRWPSTHVQLWHRVYCVTPELACNRWGDEVASVVPTHGLVDVHTYATAQLLIEPVVLDVTFPIGEWDGESPMEVASGPGEDQLAGPEVMAEKQRLVAAFCNAAEREPFIAALTAAFCGVS